MNVSEKIDVLLSTGLFEYCKIPENGTDKKLCNSDLILKGTNYFIYYDKEVKNGFGVTNTSKLYWNIFDTNTSKIIEWHVSPPIFLMSRKGAGILLTTWEPNDRS